MLFILDRQAIMTLVIHSICNRLSPISYNDDLVSRKRPRAVPKFDTASYDKWAYDKDRSLLETRCIPMIQQVRIKETESRLINLQSKFTIKID
jgi:hypothetical protein